MPQDTSIYGNILVPQPMQQLGQTVGVAQGIQGLQESQFNLRMKQLQNARERLGSLAANKDTSYKDVLGSIGDMVEGGDLTPSQAAILSKNVNPKDPMAFVKSQLVNTLESQAKLEALYPKPELQDFGGGMLPITRGQVPGAASYGVNPAPGRVPAELAGPGNSLMKTIPPVPLETVNELGAKGYTTPAEIGLGQGQRAPKASVEGSTPSREALSRTTALPLGDPEILKAGAKIYEDDLFKSANAKEVLNPLEKAIPELQKLGVSGSGPGAAHFALVKNFLKTAGLVGEGDVDKATMLDKVTKYLAQNANSMDQRTTDFRLARDVLGAPNPQTSNRATELLAQNQLALKRQDIAAQRAFAETGKPPSAYPSWKAKWTGERELKGYIFDMLSHKDQQEEMNRLRNLPAVNGKANPEYTKFLKAYRASKDQGLLVGGE